MVDVLFLDDDPDYVLKVVGYFGTSSIVTDVRLHPSVSLAHATSICNDHDIRVAIVDLSLTDGGLGTDAIAAIREFDKKIVFIVHSVHEPSSIADWCAMAGVPYSSLFYLQKRSNQEATIGLLCALTHKALRSYVPHFAPSLISVGRDVSTLTSFSELHPSFRQSGVAKNIHYSQDVLNKASQWASDRLARAGYDSTRIAVAMTGSFARLEGGSSSDADYFVVFNDIGLAPKELSELIGLAYQSFEQMGRWFEKHDIPVHGFLDPRKTPNQISWHTSTLPTWFPVSSFLSARLGRNSQIELTKLWFMLESFPLFNTGLYNSIRAQVSANLGIAFGVTARDALVHSDLAESFHLLALEFETGFRHQARSPIKRAKHHFMRQVNLFSLRLWMLRVFLDPTMFESPAEQVLSHLTPHPLIRIIEFHEFLTTNAILSGRNNKECLSQLAVICNLYADAVSALPLKSLRESTAAETSVTNNDLDDSGKRCEIAIAVVLRQLANSPIVQSHPDLARLRILEA